MPEGGRMALDLRSARDAAKAGEVQGWRALAKGQHASIDQLEARALIIDGVAFADTALMRSGSMGLGVSGRAGLTDGQLDLRLLVKPGVPTDRALTPSDLSGGDTIVLRGSWNEPTLRRDDTEAR
jgi:hypothetical protein